MPYGTLLPCVPVHYRDVKRQTYPFYQLRGITKNLLQSSSAIMTFVKRSIWAKNYFNDSTFDGDYMKIKPEQWEGLLDQLSRTA